MQQETHNIPTRRGSTGTHIDTRPIYIEEWLDSLPYIDFNKTSQLLLEATSQTNRENIKPEVRLELVTLYHRPYQYYLESQVRSGAQHTLQSMETMQAQIAVLKQIALNLAQACSLSIEQGVQRKTIWRQKKSPLPAILMQMNYLAQTLIFSFLEYSAAPENVWRDLNGLFYHVENMGQEHATVIPPGGNAKKDATTITSAYKCILLASMVDPYRLPFGAIWEIYGQCRRWQDRAQLKAFADIDNPEGIYVIDLEGDSPPIAYGKFNPKAVQESHRLISTTELGALVNSYLDQLNSGKALDDEVQLSGFYAKQILEQMSSAWKLPALRYSPRVRSEGSVQVTSGMNAIYYYLNGAREFVAPETRQDENIITDTVGGVEAIKPGTTPGYAMDQWEIIDQGPGGFSICKKVKPKVPVKVGDLIGIMRGSDAGKAEDNLALGIIRWLLIGGDRSYKIGIQTVAVDIIPAAIRALTGTAMETSYSRAMIAGDFSHSGANAVICAAGLYGEGREYELRVEGKTLRARAGDTVESTASFNHFNLGPL